MPESSGSRGQSDVGGLGLQPVRPSFSMDTPLMNSIVGRVKPEESIIDEEGTDANFEDETSPKNRAKHWNSSEGAMDSEHSDIERSLSSSGRGFFFSKYGQLARIHSMPV
ncbi:RING-H2 finger protein [Musa troglodytarum]|uniref:RING-H2 finger protein n=1 Tax=Musa troglodytarum TaxID=320322 RepID=A0A9E7GP19_9LILI|nr:RING-H2 finger protein [Musa troglodytarum]